MRVWLEANLHVNAVTKEQAGHTRLLCTLYMHSVTYLKGKNSYIFHICKNFTQKLYLMDYYTFKSTE